MEPQERIEEAYLKWIEKSYAYMLFEELLRLKWRRVALAQGGRI